MKPHTLAVREAQAWDRILAAVKAKAKAEGVQVSGLDATHRDPALQQLFRMEALADLLEAQAEPAKPAKTTAKKSEGKL